MLTGPIPYSTMPNEFCRMAVKPVGVCFVSATRKALQWFQSPISSDKLCFASE